MDKLREDVVNGKQWLRFSMVAVFLWGMLAHGYCFFNNAISHDSMREFHGAIVGNDIKLAAGRIFVPLYRDLLRSDATLPWLIGALSLIWIGLAVFLVIRMLRIESKGLAFLTAGVFAANITVASTAATYLHDLDCNMFSLLLAVSAVYVWRQLKWGWVLGAPLLMVSLGIYQSFLFVAITIIMILCMTDLLQGVKFRTVMSNGLCAIGMILIGGALYFVSLKVSHALTEVALSSGKYNSLDTILELNVESFIRLSRQAYGDFFYRLLNAWTSYPGILVKLATFVLLGGCAVSLVFAVLDRSVGVPERILLVLLAGLLPFGMNMIYVLMQGFSHDVMVYAIWLFWLLAILLPEQLWKKHGKRVFFWQRQLCMFLVAVLLYGTAQFANGMYLKKDIEYDANLSLMTRIVERMEDCEDYVAGETPVYFIGLPDGLLDAAPGFKDYWGVTGMESSGMMTRMDQSYYQSYFDYVLCMPLLQATQEQQEKLIREYDMSDLSGYPAKNCVAMYDGILVVKLGEIE